MVVATPMSHNQYRACPAIACYTASHLRSINITRLSIVTCGMFSHSSCRAIHRWTLFAGSGRTTNCLIKDIPDVFYWRQIRDMCWIIKHTDVFVVQKSSANAATVGSGIVVLENGVVVAKKSAGRSGAVSHRGIWLHSDYQQWLAVVWCVHGIFPPKPVRIPRRVPPCNLRCRHHPYMLLHICSVNRESPLNRHSRGHSSIVLASSGCASWPRQVAVVVEQGWGPIHLEGEVHGDCHPSVDFGQFEAKSVHWIDRLSHLQWVWLVWDDRRDEESRYSGPGRGRSIDDEGPCDSTDGHSAIEHAYAHSYRPYGSCGILQITIIWIFWVAFNKVYSKVYQECRKSWQINWLQSSLPRNPSLAKLAQIDINSAEETEMHIGSAATTVCYVIGTPGCGALKMKCYVDIVVDCIFGNIIVYAV